MNFLCKAENALTTIGREAYLEGDSQIGKKIEMTKDNIDAGGKKQRSRIDEILKDIKAIQDQYLAGLRQMFQCLQCRNCKIQPCLEESKWAIDCYRIFCPKCNSAIYTSQPAAFLSNKGGYVLAVDTQKGGQVMMGHQPQSAVTVYCKLVQLTDSVSPFVFVQ